MLQPPLVDFVSDIENIKEENNIKNLDIDNKIIDLNNIDGITEAILQYIDLK